MGMATAWRLAQRGAQVTVFERDDRTGGMSAHVDFAGTSIERYYHFVCGPDQTTFDWLAEFGLSDKLRWVDTHMGYWWGGRLHDWGHLRKAARWPEDSVFKTPLFFGMAPRTRQNTARHALESVCGGG